MAHSRSYRLLTALLAVALCVGCASTMVVPDSGSPEGARHLGPVRADSGKWPISLNAPPPTDQIHAELRRAAAKEYGVSEGRVVLTGIEMSVMAELNGTIRKWKATGEAYAR